MVGPKARREAKLATWDLHWGRSNASFGITNRTRDDICGDGLHYHDMSGRFAVLWNSACSFSDVGWPYFLSDDAPQDEISY